MLVIYVDDFKLESMSRGWELLGAKIKLEEPRPIGRYLGCGGSRGRIQPERRLGEIHDSQKGLS